MKTFITKAWIILIISIFFLWSCGGGSNDSSESPASTEDTGILTLTMVDAPGGSYKAVYVTIKEVQVCMETGLCDGEGESEDCECQWETIATLNKTYDLLKLVNGVMATLGQKDLEAGTYNQMRLLLDDEQDDSLNLFDDPHPYPQYLIEEDDDVNEMKVPSGYQSGIKLVHPFEIVNNLTTELILDFDVASSVVKAGNSGKYVLKPTIKVIGTNNRAVVSGVVTTDDETPVPLEGAMVRAWHKDGTDNWIEAMNTFADNQGQYRLYLNLGGEYELDPEEYKIVAMADGYKPSCETLTVAVDQTYPDTDFALTPAEMVSVTGIITGTVASENADTPVVAISFSTHIGSCFPEPVETASVLVTDDANDETPDVYYHSYDGSFQYIYSIDLPTGAYDVTASCEGLDPEEVQNFIADDPVPDLDFDFNN